jgi:hypothetical protein
VGIVSGSQGSGVQAATVSLSSAQILTMGASPVTIVPAPGANKAALPCAQYLRLAAGGIPYATSTAVEIRWVAASVFASTFSLIGTEIQIETRISAFSTSLANVANLPLVVMTSNAVNPTAGNGTLRATVYYSIVDVT